ncbi:hypothetical protein NEOLEDRAFT_1141819 [Neolentinus lepideus HHB14362 ss-1]|uniref:Protein kinase domain-containing protein n=1 Tax=Neolentinus lepideus HHB14362 ss-1 TaxID=1314782 RepID=A0A165NI10_9AGAM|nr:hypothetical protein NEOLEDRAFT_1141819 [Neolentinus lepideus HHB14362 ss-1]
MSGYFLGPMPIETFLEKFAPAPAATTPELVPPEQVFSSMKGVTGETRERSETDSNAGVPTKEAGVTQNTTAPQAAGTADSSCSKGKEAPMYKSFISCIKASKLCSALRFVDTSSKGKEDRADEWNLRPDVSVYSTDAPGPPDRTSWQHMEMCIEMKDQGHEDPFADPPRRTPSNIATTATSSAEPDVDTTGTAIKEDVPAADPQTLANDSCAGTSMKDDVHEDPFADPERCIASTAAPSAPEPDAKTTGAAIETDASRADGQILANDSSAGTSETGQNATPSSSARFSAEALRRSEAHKRNSRSASPYTFERDTDSGTRTRVQISDYARLMWHYQHRTFFFQVLIMKDFARLLRYDRAGVIVSEAFRYQKTPYLAQFFRAFNALDASRRGKDTTVTLASKEEAESAKIVFANSNSDAADENSTIFKVLVNDDRCDKAFFVAKPAFRYPSAIGRGTRCYVAADLETGNCVFLKDSWRYDVDGIRQEGAIYKDLNAEGVSNIAQVLCHGDVPDQTTLTADFVNASWAGQTRSLSKHKHYRIVLDAVGRTLDKASSSRSIVKAIRDILVAHKEAYEKVDILHRDLSFYNIVLIGDGDDERGILIDWDLSRSLTSLDTEDARVRGRTGTWQFISHALLQNPTKKHTIQDDLESSFWILLWTFLHYIPSTLQTSQLHHIMDRVFDECSWSSAFCYYEGGEKKESVFTKGLTGATRCSLSFPHAPPLDQLIASLRTLFKRWVNYSSDLQSNAENALPHNRPYLGLGDWQNVAELNPTSPNIPKSDDVIKLFDDALASPGWPTTRDIVEDLIPQKPRHEPHSNSKLKRSSDFEGNSTAKIQRRSAVAEAGSSLRRQVLEE